MEKKNVIKVLALRQNCYLLKMIKVVYLSLGSGAE